MGCRNNVSQVLTGFTVYVYSWVMAVLYKSLVTCGTLSVLLLNDRGINLFQFLFTLKRVLMKQMQIQQKEAFLLSTLTSVPKKYYIFNEKVSRNKMQGEIILTNILKLFLWLRECFQLLALCHCSATQSFTLSMSSTCLFTNCGLLVGC